MCIQCIYTHTLPAATHHQLFVILSMITCWLEWDTHNALTRGTDCVSTLPHINQRGCTHTMTYMYYTHTCKHTQRHLMAQSMMLSLSLMKNERTALFVYSRVCFWLSCLFSTPVLLHRYFVKAKENISLQVCFVMKYHKSNLHAFTSWARVLIITLMLSTNAAQVGARKNNAYCTHRAPSVTKTREALSLTGNTGVFTFVCVCVCECGGNKKKPWWKWRGNR